MASLYSALRYFFILKVMYIVFPGCRVLLDAVHVDRYFRDKVFGGKSNTNWYVLLFSFLPNNYQLYNNFITFVAGARFENGSDVNKYDLLEKILQCRDAHTPEQYNHRRVELMVLTDGLLIRPGRVKNEVLFKDYWDTNWEKITPMWVFAFRKGMPLQVSTMKRGYP